MRQSTNFPVIVSPLKPTIAPGMVYLNDSRLPNRYHGEMRRLRTIKGKPFVALDGEFRRVHLYTPRSER